MATKLFSTFDTPRFKMHLVKSFVFSFGILLNGPSFADNFYQQYQQQAEEIVAQMSTEQKIGQMILPTFAFLTANRGPDALTEAKAAWYLEPDLLTLGKICGFEAISKFHIGAVLQDGGPLAYSGDDQTTPQWLKVSQMANLFYTGPAGTNLLLGTDSVHGDQHVTGSILFPHNIGLGATHNKGLIEQIGYWNARNMQSTGFNWSFSPTVAVGYDYRWGRFYECYSANLALIKAFGRHYINGLQGIANQKLSGVLATAKHFIGDGDTQRGTDEGDGFSKSLKKCWKENGAGYEGAVEASVGSIMASYSSLNDIPMHFGGDFDILNQFRNEGIQGKKDKIYRLEGFVVSDYVGVSRAIYKCLQTANKCHLLDRGTQTRDFHRFARTIARAKKHDSFSSFNSKDPNDLFDLYVRGIAKSVNAGVDMFMIANNAAWFNPFDYEKKPPHAMLSPLYYNKIEVVVNALSTALSRGLISQEKLDDAVTRIIRVKLSLAATAPTPPTADEIAAEASISLQAAEQSLVLLKNKQDLLPVQPSTIKNIFLIGAYDDIGSQNGGWTVTWQGQKGNKYWLPGSSEKASSHATSILDGIRSIFGNSVTLYEGEDAALHAKFKNIASENSIAIVAIGEPPYAEYNGDVDNGNPWYTRGALMGENIYMPIIQSKFLGIKFTSQQMKAIKYLKKHGVKIVTVLFSGRPIVITEGRKAPLPHSNAFIAAFLPGTSGGQAIANAIFGNYGFKSIKNKISHKTYYSNTLPFGWPASMKEVTKHHYTLFPIGYGLETSAL